MLFLKKKSSKSKKREVQVNVSGRVQNALILALALLIILNVYLLFQSDLTAFFSPSGSNASVQ